MNLQEAIQSAKEGNFVTNEYFSKEESMHYYDDKLYYEDGVIVTEEFLQTQHFATTGNWKIKYNTNQIDRKILDKIHQRRPIGLKPYYTSFEDCINIKFTGKCKN